MVWIMGLLTGGVVVLLWACCAVSSQISREEEIRCSAWPRACLPSPAGAQGGAMKAPSTTDRVVAVSAYLTDEVFGYDHWRAAQFSPPDIPRHPAVLFICRDEQERDELMTRLQALREGQ